MTIIAVDVQYHQTSAVVAGVSFSNWDAEVPDQEYVAPVENVSEYVPGSFYKRELPCILRILQDVRHPPSVIVIDGYVYLDGGLRPGLGSHLYEAMKRATAVIGVAKTRYREIGAEHELFRGKSIKPLYVTCAGTTLESAKQNVTRMHGASRIPTLLKRVDSLCRGR